MAILSRDASAASLLLDLTALSVKEPTRVSLRTSPVAPKRHNECSGRVVWYGMVWYGIFIFQRQYKVIRKQN